MSWHRTVYLAQRVTRNLLPQPVAAWGRRLFGGIPGGESSAPDFFADSYVATLARHGRSFDGASVLVFGHGPTYGFACTLLAAGAEHMYLWDPFAEPDDVANRRWLDEYPQYLERRGRRIVPHAGWMTLLEAEGDPRDVVFPSVDVVVSTSVFEHLEDPELWAGKLAHAADPDGLNVHWIDLRDHFFESPFEMLCYSDRSWRWLNPRQYLNRWRHNDYRGVFERHFGEVEIRVLNQDREGFEASRGRIQPRFLTGDVEIDSVLEIEVSAARPRREPAPSG